MLVYRFLPEKFGLISVRQRRLKISRIMMLNDPFEFLGANLSDKRLRMALTKTKHQLAENRGIICYSKTWSNPLLWSHYADGHRGLCLGFEVPKHAVTKIKYRDERFPLLEPDSLNEAKMRSFFFSKFKHWEYEQEYRSFYDLKDKDGDHFFADFSDNLRLCKVIVGANSNISRQQIKDALGSSSSGIETFKVRPAFKDFRIVRNKNEGLWR